MLQKQLLILHILPSPSVNATNAPQCSHIYIINPFWVIWFTEPGVSLIQLLITELFQFSAHTLPIIIMAHQNSFQLYKEEEIYFVFKWLFLNFMLISFTYFIQLFLVLMCHMLCIHYHCSKIHFGFQIYDTGVSAHYDILSTDRRLTNSKSASTH